MSHVVPVKRACVSVNLDMPEYDPAQPQVYSPWITSCKNCQQERHPHNKQERKKHKKQKQSQRRANTPIVIQLEDSLRLAIQQKQCRATKKKLESTELKDADAKTDKSSYRDNRESMVQKNNVKNLCTFINAVEMSNITKDSTRNIHSNLKCSSEKLVADYVLNNVSDINFYKSCLKKSIVDCENVDIICNDLKSTETAMEDTEESEISSTTSSSEIQSDSDFSNPQDSPYISEFTPEQLTQLASFTTGRPFVQYEYNPANYPKHKQHNNEVSYFQEDQFYNAQNDSVCSPYISSHQFVDHLKGQHNKSRRFAHQKQTVPYNVPKVARATIEVINVSTEHELDEFNDTVTEISVDAQSYLKKNNLTTLKPNLNYHVNKKGKNLHRSNTAGNRSHMGTHNFPYLDSIYIDLTGSDVKFTVYYYHNINDIYNNYMSSNMMETFYPMPYYHQDVYYPGYYTQLYPTIIPSDLQLEENLPMMSMVPPEELPKFNTSQPPQRQWIPLSTPEPSRPAAIFTVMCYNVLCDKYCTKQQHGYCPMWARNWEYRKKGILDEIRNCAADIIGLQEVETDQFYNFFKPELEHDGYQGIFSPKSRARTMTEQKRKHVDGCAIFFRISKFSLVREHLIEFNQLAIANAEGFDEMLNRVMTKDNIGLAALLETKEGVFKSGGSTPPEDQIRQPLLVTTAHMHWDPEYSDVKLIQTMMLMSELKKVVEDSYHELHPDHHQSGQPMDCNSIPMILCGDLNSLPDSGVIEYLSTGSVASNHLDFKELGYKACLQAFNCHKDCTQLMHKFQLAKAYEDNIMPYTNYTLDFKGIIDYIFYSHHSLNLLGVLGPMDENWFHDNKVVGCPHPHIQSDHFSLFIELEMPVPYLDIKMKLGEESADSKGW